LLSADQTTTRFQVRLHALGTAEVAQAAERLLALGEHHMGPEYRLQVTGSLYYLARDSNQLVRQQIQSFALSFFLVGALMAFSVGSLRAGIVAMIPNVLPIVITAGLLGWLGIDLSTGTAMIAAAAMGLVVDDTIHYIGAFRKNALSSLNLADAAQRTTRSTGPALIANNLVLVAGFWVGVAGSFLPTIYFSMFTGVAMLLALLYDLLVTPACLLLLVRR
jgi:predicted RND superfamily exporter protein